MGLRINTNIAALTSQFHLKHATEAQRVSQERITSGSAIAHAKEDPTGLAVAETLKMAAIGTRQNIRNAVDGMSYLETADGSLQEMTNMLIRMRELSMQSANGTVGTQERAYIDREFQALKAEIERLAQTTRLGNRMLLNGEGGNVVVQVGLNHQSYDVVDVTAPHEVTLDRLGIPAEMSDTMKNAGDSLMPLDEAINTVAAVRGAIGASESRLDSLIASREEYETNLVSTRSMIQDTDYARESATLASLNILTQSGVALLAQANNVPQLALKLLS